MRIVAVHAMSQLSPLSALASGRDPSRLSAADAAWLRMDVPQSRMIITVLMRTRTPLSYETAAALVESRLLPHPRFRLALSRRGGGGAPERLDLSRHVHRVTEPVPDERALGELVGRLMSRPLDPARPLWEVHVVEQFGEGSVLVWRLHHALADGIALVRLLLSVVDSPVPEVSLPSPAERRAPLGTIRLALGAVRSLLRLVALRHDHPTPLRGPLSGHKVVAWSRPLTLRAVHDEAHAQGATVNDLLVSALAGAVHRYLQSRMSSEVPRTLRVIVPFDLRAHGADERLGNRFGLLFLDLPISAASAHARLEEVKQRMARLKRSPEGVVAYRLLELIGRITPVLAAGIVRLFGRKATAVLTNVAGPRDEVSLCGAPVETLAFWVPHAGGLGVGFSILSYAGSVRLGVAADRLRVPDPERLAQAFEDELRALCGECLQRASD